MRYEYKCPKCGVKLERTVKIADRDNQVCRESILMTSKPAGGFTFQGQVNQYQACGSQLEREEISLTARMPQAWK